MSSRSVVVTQNDALSADQRNELASQVGRWITAGALTASGMDEATFQKECERAIDGYRPVEFRDPKIITPGPILVVSSIPNADLARIAGVELWPRYEKEHGSNVGTGVCVVQLGIRDHSGVGSDSRDSYHRSLVSGQISSMRAGYGRELLAAIAVVGAGWIPSVLRIMMPNDHTEGSVYSYSRKRSECDRGTISYDWDMRDGRWYSGILTKALPRPGQ